MIGSSELLIGLVVFAIAWVAVRGGGLGTLIAPASPPTTPAVATAPLTPGPAPSPAVGPTPDARDRDDTLDLAVQLPPLGLGHLAPIVQAVAVGNHTRVNREMDSLWQLVLSDDRTKLAYVRQRIVDLQRAESALAVKIDNPEALPAADQVAATRTTARTRTARA